MKKVQQGLMALLCCLSLIGCGDDALKNPDSPTTPPKVSKLTVLLKDANTQDSLANTQVNVVSNTQKTYTQTTNANGSAIEIRLTPAQIDYIEEKITFNKKYYGLALKAGN